MLWYLPLEHLDQRYTVMMDRQVVSALVRRGIEYSRVYGRALTEKIEQGAFLDSEGTNFFKASQLQAVALAFKEGRVRDGDKFFVSDLWFPGLEAIPYMAMFRGIDVEVWGIMHAGSWTETDFVRGLRKWARFVELGWFEMCAGVFVGSEFHRQDILAKRRCLHPEKVHATGLVFSTEDVKAAVPELPSKRDLVVFAGRTDDEKQPWLFDELAKRIGPPVEFVKSYDLNLDKGAYFRLLAEAKVVFSAALQENFGYSMLEAATLGAVPVVPDRLAYTEIWPEACRYESMEHAEALVRRYLRTSLDLSNVPARFDSSFERMLEVMRL